MATAEELIRDAQHAFQNISPGSADEKKYTARAKKLARRIVGKFPQSMEANQAREILRSLGEIIAIAKFAESAHTRHSHRAAWRTPHKSHSQNDESTPLNSVKKLEAAAKALLQKKEGYISSDEASWQGLWQKFSDLSYFKRKVVVFVLFFVILFFGNQPLLLFAFVFYAFQPQLIREHVDHILDALA